MWRRVLRSFWPPAAAAGLAESERLRSSSSNAIGFNILAAGMIVLRRCGRPSSAAAMHASLMFLPSNRTSRYGYLTERTVDFIDTEPYGSIIGAKELSLERTGEFRGAANRELRSCVNGRACAAFGRRCRAGHSARDRKSVV